MDWGPNCGSARSQTNEKQTNLKVPLPDCHSARVSQSWEVLGAWKFLCTSRSRWLITGPLHIRPQSRFRTQYEKLKPGKLPSRQKTKPLQTLSAENIKCFGNKRCRRRGLGMKTTDLSFFWEQTEFYASRSLKPPAEVWWAVLETNEGRSWSVLESNLRDVRYGGLTEQEWTLCSRASQSVVEMTNNQVQLSDLCRLFPGRNS